MTARLEMMVETGIGSREWADQIIHHMFEEPNMESGNSKICLELSSNDKTIYLSLSSISIFLTELWTEDRKDPYLMGEFEVIKELLAKFPEMGEGKVMADKMIDMCGTPPEGNGILNVRKCIIQTKYKYDAASEDRQIVWKKMIINFIERYFFIVCFATYAKEHGKEGFKKTFVDWLKDKQGLKEMIEAGKDKLEWERKVDSQAVSKIKESYDSITENFCDQFGLILYELYKISYETYKDIPRGEIKVEYSVKYKRFRHPYCSGHTDEEANLQYLDVHPA